MSIHTYRAKSMQEALELVRRDLGPDASVLHSREVNLGILGWLRGARQIEVAASNTVEAPSRLSDETSERPTGAKAAGTSRPAAVPPAHEHNFGAQFRRDLRDFADESDSLVEDLCRESDDRFERELFRASEELRQELAAFEVPKSLAEELLDQVRQPDADGAPTPHLLKTRLLALVAQRIATCGPIRLMPGRRRLVAFVGPTGVGKTTTIAKLAAQFRQTDKCRVGLISTENSRAGRLESLPTLRNPRDSMLAVVSNATELREALARLAHVDLVLLDTGGCNPRDEAQLRELKLMLIAAQPDEIHLVLSATSGATNLGRAVERFTSLGASALVLTKLDESLAPGGLLPLLFERRLPLSYVASGQQIPGDIEPADCRSLSRLLVGGEST